ncbi:predicted protein [Nematostella vectensis]|uniref:Uncharacterized protein n=1 Tax=Nematostella vectensis TaxID=45351 RepID=A7SEE3_NEMVE|nr:predicted protein [Nematostella vectensis]|eukprot:XP_001629976.1 predicted protein [Nematostella vectensis]
MTEALETQTRNQCSFCGNQEIILSCQGNRHIFCLECLSNCFRAKLSGPDVFSYRCPLEQVCGSVLCSDLTRDVLNSAHHGDLSSDIDQAALQSATKEPTQSCPNCSGQFLLNPHLDFQDLFVTCPHCQIDICQTCDHALGPHGVSEHLCTTDSPSMRHVVEELLTKASTVTCPNIDCRLSPIIKEKESCNMIKCPKCAQCFCYICEMLLGTDELEAHTSFPHVNPSIPSAPCCWIFDDEPSKANFKSVSGFRLKNHAFKAVKTGELKLCIRACGDDQRCKSINYRLRGQDPDNCELNDADETEDGGNYGKDDGYIYHKIGKRKIESAPTPLPEVSYKSCAELKAARPSTPSGNYVMHVRGFKRTVYCDMDTAGGGWSLVVAISSSNQEHHKTRTVNCFNSSLCVAKESGLLTARKLSDLDIRALAFYEGTFKIDMLTDSYGLVFTHYYRLAEGAQVFSSGCEGNTGVIKVRWLLMVIEGSVILMVIEGSVILMVIEGSVVTDGDRGVDDGDRGFGDGDRGFGDGDRGFGDGDRGFGDGDRGFGDGDRGVDDGDRGVDDGDRGFDDGNTDGDQGFCGTDGYQGFAGTDGDQGFCGTDGYQGFGGTDVDQGFGNTDGDQGFCVFDGHDNAECGETWFGTGYRAKETSPPSIVAMWVDDHVSISIDTAGQRILYGTCGHNGVNNAFQAQVYVK